MLNEYDRREAYLVYQSSLLRGSREDGIEEGLKRGLKEGELNKAILMAKAMKSDGADINLISKYTGLNLEEIEKL